MQNKKSINREIAAVRFDVPNFRKIHKHALKKARKSGTIARYSNDGDSIRAGIFETQKNEGFVVRQGKGERTMCVIQAFDRTNGQTRIPVSFPSINKCYSIKCLMLNV